MQTEIAIKLGLRIKKFREAQGFTQAQLAELLGKTVETVSNFERGQVMASVLTLEQLAGELSISVRDLFDDGPIKNKKNISRNALTVQNASQVLPEEDLEILAGLADVLESRRRQKT